MAGQCGGALVVDRIGTSGQDGIATNVAPALEWEVDLRLAGLEPGAIITYTAVTDRPPLLCEPPHSRLWRSKMAKFDVDCQLGF